MGALASPIGPVEPLPPLLRLKDKHNLLHSPLWFFGDVAFAGLTRLTLAFKS